MTSDRNSGPRPQEGRRFRPETADGPRLAGLPDALRCAGFDETARERLLQHSYPGNVRELDHVVERAVLMSQGRQIKAGDLGLTTGRDESTRLEDMSLEEVEAFLIKKALARADGNARKAAEALGLSRSAFYRRLQHYGL